MASDAAIVVVDVFAAEAVVVCVVNDDDVVVKCFSARRPLEHEHTRAEINAAIHPSRRTLVLRLY